MGSPPAEALVHARKKRSGQPASESITAGPKNPPLLLEQAFLGGSSQAQRACGSRSSAPILRGQGFVVPGALDGRSPASRFDPASRRRVLAGPVGNLPRAGP